MDGEPSLTAPAPGMDVLMMAGYLPPTDLYATVIHHFPGNHAHVPWGTSGTFFFDAKIFANGKQIAVQRSDTCDEKGNLRMDVSAAAEKAGPDGVTSALRGMYIVEYHHPHDIPINIYAFHIHRATGTYVPCNILPFIGDKLYPKVHSGQMENALFWPGTPCDDESDAAVVVVNPYDVNMGFQIHLIGRDGVAQRTGMLKLRPKSADEFPLARCFETFDGKMRKDGGAYSLCVSSQYKLVAFIMVKNREQQVMSMMDHLHNFCLV